MDTDLNYDFKMIGLWFIFYLLLIQLHTATPT